MLISREVQTATLDYWYIRISFVSVLCSVFLFYFVVVHFVVEYLLFCYFVVVILQS